MHAGGFELFESGVFERRARKAGVCVPICRVRCDAHVYSSRS